MASRLIFALGGLVLLAAGIGAAVFATRLDQTESSPAPAAPLVEVARPEPVPAPPAIVETGFVRASERVRVAPEISGRIVEIGETFELGSRMAEGDLLVRLDARTIEADLARAKADLDSAEAALAQTTADLRRQRELAGENFAAEAEVERARADAEAADARVAQAQAAVESAEIRLQDTRLTAPFDALVIAEDVSRGQLLQVGTPVGTLVASDAAEVRVGLTEDDFRRLRQQGGLIGRAVEVEVEDGRRLAGTIARVAPVLEGRARTVEIVVTVPDPYEEDRGLILNGVASVSIPLPQSERMLYRLPAGALQDGDRLWRVTGEGTLQPVAARVQDRGDDTVTLASDALEAGDRILVTELATPLPGLEVRVREDSEDTDATATDADRADTTGADATGTDAAGNDTTDTTDTGAAQAEAPAPDTARDGGPAEARGGPAGGGAAAADGATEDDGA
jgi:RND family efflux transporter MFP subunit